MQRCFYVVIALALSAAVLTQAQPITTGRAFKFAIPYNGGDLSSSNSDIQILVSSAYDRVEFDVYRVREGIFVGDKFVTGEAGTVFTVDRTNAAALFDSIEITPDESERITDKVLTVISSEPVSVTVVNTRGASSDGWKPMPIHLCGTEHRVVSYWDQAGSGGSGASGGFVIVPVLKTTEIKLVLGGVASGTASTVRGRVPGDTLTVRVGRDSAYVVMGDGTTTGSFDLTGSLITASAPVAVIGFHARTSMPGCVPNLSGSDHLVEEVPPVKSWSKEYITTSVLRTPTNAAGKGDVFRILAHEAGTQWALHYYDPMLGQLIGTESGVLGAGQFHTIEACTPSELPNGTVVVTANKPILVAQYSTSSAFDGAADSDPFMVIVPGTSQFVHAANFHTPSLGDSERHSLKLTVRAPSEEDARSVLLDGVPLWDHTGAAFPPLLLSKVPGTEDLYTTTVELADRPSMHTLSANERTTMGGFAYGFGAERSYAYPVAGMQRNAAIEDTVKPVLNMRAVDIRWSISATDGAGTAGMEGIVLMPGYQNCFLYVPYGIMRTGSSYYLPPEHKYDSSDASAVVRPLRCKERLKAVIVVRDHQENAIEGTLDLRGVTLDHPEELDLGVIAPYQVVEGVIELRNTGTEPETIYTVSENTNRFTVMLTYYRDLPVTIMPDSVLSVRVRYQATSYTPETRPYDSIIVQFNSCADVAVKVRAICSGSRLAVQDRTNPANHVAVGSTRCDSNCIVVINQSVDAVTIQSVFTDEHPEFSFRDVPESSFTLEPGHERAIASVCYSPKDLGPDSALIQVVTASGYLETDIKRFGAMVTSVGESRQVPEDVTIEDLTVHARFHAYRVIVYDLLGRQLLTGLVRPGEPLAIVRGFVTFQRMGEER